MVVYVTLVGITRNLALKYRKLSSHLFGDIHWAAVDLFPTKISPFLSEGFELRGVTQSSPLCFTDKKAKMQRKHIPSSPS